MEPNSASFSLRTESSLAVKALVKRTLLTSLKSLASSGVSFLPYYFSLTGLYGSTNKYSFFSPSALIKRSELPSWSMPVR